MTSWGPDDDGKTIDGPHYLTKRALQFGTNYGRNGYGAVYVVAGGNGGSYEDNCNYDGYTSSVYTIAVGAVDDTGRMPPYGEPCASLLAVALSNGLSAYSGIVSTELLIDRLSVHSGILSINKWTVSDWHCKYS